MNTINGGPISSMCQAEGHAAETSVFDFELLEALQAELHEYRKESEYVKKLITLARLWSDARADRESHSTRRKLVDLKRENAVLKRRVKELGGQ